MSKLRSAILDVMISTVRREGSKLIRDHNRILLLQESKGLRNYCDIAKNGIFTAIKQSLYRLFPHLPCVDNCDVIDGFVFILDNEAGFMRGLEDFAIILNFFAAEEIVATVWYVPIFDRLYWAEKNKGAFADSTKLRRRNLACDDPVFLFDSLLISTNSSLLRKCCGIGTLHMFNIYNLCLVRYARGCYDVLFFATHHNKSLTAGFFLLEESGIQCSTVDEHCSVYASNRLLNTLANI